MAGDQLEGASARGVVRYAVLEELELGFEVLRELIARAHDPGVAWRIDPEGAETQALASLVRVDGLRVLELGCGDGRLTFLYASPAASVLAVDPDAERIADARAALPPELDDAVTFLVAGAAEVDRPHGSFDLALFSSSL